MVDFKLPCYCYLIRAFSDRFENYLLEMLILHRMSPYLMSSLDNRISPPFIYI